MQDIANKQIKNRLKYLDCIKFLIVAKVNWILPLIKYISFREQREILAFDKAERHLN